MPQRGTVKSFDAETGSGYISVDSGGPDVYVDSSAVQSRDGSRSLEENQRVEFEITQGSNGPQAQAVRSL
ncbi:cold-shock protein [Streptomyces sp. B1I3]|uniref:cold-shock protein n=1 Tax=Streptomyces sp. B1I3 TaxID=3042264 RepID=UPI00278002DC|nr:cold shock domain-containing protein [Streptomyces sp. B1I3]MDQ0791693.1 CspA family cold shock protein [Streptomyces sp. B1I3]